MKKRAVWLLITGVILLYTACVAPIVVPDGEGARVPALPPKVEIRVAFTSELDFGDLPSLLAFQELETQGYRITPTYFGGAELAVAALAAGDADIGFGSLSAYTQAIDQGAPIRLVMEQSANNWTLVTRPGILQCLDLDGALIATGSAGSISKALTVAYVQQNCPDTTLEWLYISGSSNRAAALLAGQLDATPLELSDTVLLERLSPDSINVLVNFAEDLPLVIATGIYSNLNFAEGRPDALRDFIQAFLTVHRRLHEDASPVAAQAVQQLAMDASDADVVTQAYMNLRMWDVNGGLTDERVQHSLAFYASFDAIPDNLTADNVADLTYLESVLDVITRR